MNKWYTDFLNNPNQAITDLFSGRAGLGSSLRLDIPELLYQEFPDTPEFTEPRQLLDHALLHWLNTMRSDYAAQVRRLGYGIYSKRLCDALTSIQLLDLPITTYHLRETASSWLNWLAPLRLAPERDPALEYWRVLTHRQDQHASPAPWLQLADDPRPEYLSVALVGLQRLPNGHDARRNQQTQLFALLQHAVLLPDSGKACQFFNQHFAALRATYPAAPDHWQMLLETVIRGFKVQTAIARDLLENLQQPAKPQRATSPIFAQPADKAETDTLLDDIKTSRHSAEALAQRLFTTLEKNYAYSQATGDSYFFVTTLSNLGERLLKRHKLSAAALNRLQLMVERGLSLQPMNQFVWMLWANCLAHSGHSDAQQWVLREAVRLFPNNEASFVELARLLMRQGNDQEAERWLRDVVERSPNNEPSRVELARLLMRQGNDQEAEHWLREAAERNPNAEPSRVELARLLMRQGNDQEAERWLRDVVERSPNNEPSRVELARLLMRQGNDQEAERWLRDVVERSPNNEPSRVVLAKLWVKQGKTPEAEGLLTKFLDRYPQNNQAQKLLKTIKNGSIDLSSWLDFDADDGIDHEIQSASKLSHNQQASDSSVPSIADNDQPSLTQSKTMSDLLSELQRRARLQSEFNQARSLSADTDYILQEAEKGDALACFYQQWLKSDEALNLPPHAWAAHACRLYQTRAPETDWQQLNQTFPEHRLANRYLHLQTVEDENETAALLKKLSSDANALTPLQQFIYQALEADNPPDHDNLALAVLASDAASAPQIVSC
ncbi:MAG: tetratricopeptide repeat protein [Methylovulum sp.]|nr:tetratricopeptide repeat protein [Methylovulum sp.]